MKWIKNGNQLINMSSIGVIRVSEFSDRDDTRWIIFDDYEGNTPMTLKYDNLETAEAHFDAIAMFLENQHTTIMAMAPTIEESL